jgi:hypothetical protein
VYGKSVLIKEQYKNEGTERQMIGNVPELQEAARREVVVREVGTAAHEFLATAPFAIHVVMHLISFKTIAKCSIENKIVKSTNLKDNLLLSEDLSVEVGPLPHYIVLLPLDFIPLPHFFIVLPQSLLKNFDFLSFFRAARDETTPLCSATTTQPSKLSPSGSRLRHLAWNTYNMYYIRIYHDIASTKD